MNYAPLFAVLLSSATSLLAADLPAVPIAKAVELAQGALAAKGSPQGVYIKSINLEKSTLLAKAPIWLVNWSETIPATLPGSREYGLEINMAGDVVHLVKGKAAK